MTTRDGESGTAEPGTGRDPLVHAEGVSKWYGQVSGLNNVTVSIPPGITGLLGPNGAGKSTFMKLMTGQLKPSQGTIRVLGEPIWGNPRVYARIGFCPEQDAFYDRMTGLEWVTALVRLNGLSDADADAAAKRALERVDLLDAADKKIGAYSKGMRQRVKLAQALVHDPELLILDEPLTGMDPLMRRKTIRLIKDWARAGKHIIVSSHILHEIESMTSNILLINNGRILAEGNVHQIRDLIDTHPHTVYVRGADPRALARRFLAEDDVLSMKFETGAVVVETARPDSFYARLTELAASRRGRADRRSAVARRQPAGRLQVPGEAMTATGQRRRPAACRHAPRMSFLDASRRVFDLSLGEMLWSRRTIFMALVVGGPVLLALIVKARRDVRHVGAARQRPARRRLRHLRRDDLDAVPALHRPGARRVLRHGADGRRSRRQDHHLPVHAARFRAARCWSGSSSPISRARSWWCCRR